MPTKQSQRRSSAASPRGDAKDLAGIIHERIANRLGCRVRNLAVAVDRGVVRLAGQCSTFYSKQLAQHAVLGVIEDETVDNAIEVSLPEAR